MTLRVLMTADAVGGVWTYALELARAMSDTEFVIATLGPLPSEDQIAEASSIPNVELRSRDCALEWMPDPWRDVERSGRWLLQLESELRPDIIHINGYAHASLPFRYPVIAVAHSCVTTWWRAVHRTDPPAEWTEYRRRLGRGLAGADLVVAPTRSMLEELHHSCEFPTQSRVIPNGIDLSQYHAGPKERFVFAAGRMWDEAKNVQRLAEAAKWIPWPVVIAGESRERKVEGAELTGRLSREEMRARLSRASIFVHVALYEPFGLAPLEAARSGCALVLSDIASLRENWEGAAVFVDPRNARAIAREVSRLTSDEGARAQLASSARQRASRFDAGSMAAAYRAVYEELLGRRSASAERVRTAAILPKTPHLTSGEERKTGIR